jgi:hypothetical protein
MLLLDLPLELLMLVFSFLESPADILSLRHTCRQLQMITQIDQVWEGNFFKTVVNEKGVWKSHRNVTKNYFWTLCYASVQKRRKKANDRFNKAQRQLEASGALITAFQSFSGQYCIVEREIYDELKDVVDKRKFELEEQDTECEKRKKRKQELIQ